jgi:predicted TIM-barrel fold metal-dependent hydrolase
MPPRTSLHDEPPEWGRARRTSSCALRRYFATVVTCIAVAQSPAQPAVDHHQHLFSPRIAELTPNTQPITADNLITLLDAAGIERAIVLSVAYQFSNPNRAPVANEYEAVAAENDWTSQEVARFPGRLRGFCSVNPLRAYAVEEIARCAGDAQLGLGIKLHLGNSDVDLREPEHVDQLRRTFATANDRGMAVLLHLRPSITMRRAYGAAEASVFLTRVLSAAPDVPVQIAHLGGSGGYDDPAVDEALGVFVEAIARDDPLTDKLYFDVSGVAGIGAWTADKAEQVATRIRQLGLERVFYGSDAAVPGNSPLEAWENFKNLPLAASELIAIEGNIAPYAR